MDFLLDILFYVFPPSMFIYLLKKFDLINAGNIYKDFKITNNVIGYGKAEGLYLVISNNYYIVAGKQISSKTAAIKEFIELCNKNELTNKDFKILRNTFKTKENIEDMDKIEITEALEKIESNEIISKKAIQKVKEIEKNKQTNLKNNFNKQFKNQQNINKTVEKQIKPKEINFEL